jgi:PPE-repeat protein
MLAAAAAWDGLAADLESAAHSYESVVSELAIGWTGPSAAAMASAVRPYAAWMHNTAAQAEHTAVQAKTAAAAYESAFAMTVPPPVIAANRSQLMTLIATNFFGQNAPAIAATEAAYGAMWAQDATAMYVYSGDSTRASLLMPFTQPPQTTNPGGLGHQAAATSHAGTSAATNTQSTLSQLISTLQGPTSSLPGGTTSAPASPLASTSSANTAAALAIIPVELGADLFGSFVIDSAGSFVIDPAGVAIEGLESLEIGGGIPPFAAGASTAGAAPVSAGVGQAVPVGGLSVPPSWTTAAPAIRPLAAAQPAASADAASQTSAGTAANTLDDIAMTGLAGLAGTAGLGGRRKRAEATSAQPTWSQQTPPSEPKTQIGPELRELIELDDAGILTEEEFTEQKRRLLGQ